MRNIIKNYIQMMKSYAMKYNLKKLLMKIRYTTDCSIDT